MTGPARGVKRRTVLDDFAAAAERAPSTVRPELPPKRSSAVGHRGAAVSAFGVSTLLGVLIWVGVDGTGWLDDEWRYRVGTTAALIALVASLAVLALGFVSMLEGERWALFLGRRPDLIAAVALVAMLAMGVLVSGFIAMEQGGAEWEPSDKGQFLGGVAHFVAIGGLMVGLWWQRAVTVVIVATPIVTGVVAFRVSPLSTAGMGDADFRADATVADGFLDVFPYTVASALLIAAVLAFVFLRGRALRAERR